MHSSSLYLLIPAKLRTAKIGKFAAWKILRRLLWEGQQHYTVRSTTESLKVRVGAEPCSEGVTCSTTTRQFCGSGIPVVATTETPEGPALHSTSSHENWPSGQFGSRPIINCPERRSPMRYCKPEIRKRQCEKAPKGATQQRNVSKRHDTTTQRLTVVLY